jgi:hypothetical protein
MRWTAGSPALLSLLLACGHAAPSTHTAAPPLPVEPPTADLLTELATAALAADARLDPVDSLFDSDAEVIADGRHRTVPPRFAGVEAGGQIVVGSSRVDISGNFAWALLEYRWLAPGQNLIHEGKATLVFALASDGRSWRITHAHSSLVR